MKEIAYVFRSGVIRRLGIIVVPSAYMGNVSFINNWSSFQTTVIVPL